MSTNYTETYGRVFACGYCGKPGFLATEIAAHQRDDCPARAAHEALITALDELLASTFHEGDAVVIIGTADRGTVVNADRDDDGEPIDAAHVAVAVENGQGTWGFQPNELGGSLRLECPHGCGWQAVIDSSSTPGFTGAPIYWATLACGHQWVDASGDSLEAVR